MQAIMNSLDSFWHFVRPNYSLPFNQVVVGSIPTGLINDFKVLAQIDGSRTASCLTAMLVEHLI
jgi:hypothetical protein